MTEEQARAELGAREPDFLNPAKARVNGHQTYICPVCNNGSGRDGDGIAIDPTSKGKLSHYKCFKCGLNADIIELWQLHKGHSSYNPKEYPTTLKELCNLYGIQLDDQSSTRATQSSTRATAAPSPDKSYNEYHNEPQTPLQSSQKDYTEYYRKCVTALKGSGEAISYLKGRGLNLDTLTRYNIGYDEHERRIIMPVSKGMYATRSIDEGAQTPKKNSPGRADIFNADALHDNSIDAVFLCEGVIDALSIIQEGQAAIAINGTGQINLLLKHLESNRTDATLILYLDHDEPGKAATQTVIAGLQRLDIKFTVPDICPECKDPNEALQKQPQAFREGLEAAARKSSKKLYNVADYILHEMSGEIENFKEARNRSTGFKNLDEKAGGLYCGLYIVAAISSLGKTTFCSQLADQLAEAGEDVLFFSLEQSRLELVSKSISRKTARNDIQKAVDSLSIRRGYIASSSVKTATKQYIEGAAQNIYIVEGNFSCDIGFIRNTIEKHIAGKKKKPIVFVDYVQILMPDHDAKGKTTTKETIDNTVTELKRLSRDHGLTIFAISSVNRANYLTPIDFESLKETGSIEYTADVVWGLQLQCINEPVFESGDKGKLREKRQRIREAKAENPRKIELVCLKNRYGISSYNCYFEYLPRYDLFLEGKDPTQDKPKRV